METCYHGSHAAFSMHPHAVRITECRKKLLRDEVPFRVRDMIREICRQEDAETVKGHAPQDHVRLLVPIPPQAAAVLRGGSRARHRISFLANILISENMPGQAFLGARGCFCCSSGNAADKLSNSYIIEGHDCASDDNFKIDGAA